MFSFLLLFCLASDSGIALNPTLNYEPVPENIEAFLRGPSDAALDKNGRLLILDIRSKAVFVWDKKGSFSTAFGKEGQGPGEFTFNARAGGPQGYVGAVGDQIYVYDGGARILNIFDMDFKFKQSFPFTVESGRVETFRPLQNGNFLVFYSSYFSDEAFRKIALYDLEKNPIKEIAKVKDNTWHYITQGSRRRVELHAFADELVVAYNQADGQIVIGDSSKPGFSIYGLDGSLKKKVEAKIGRREVTKEDIQEYKERPWFKNQNFFTASFPDLRAYYDQLLPVGERRFLLLLNSPQYSNYEGFLVDDEGNNLGRVHFPAGEGGNLFSVNGRLFGCTTDEDGEYSLRELSVGEARSGVPGPG